MATSDTTTDEPPRRRRGRPVDPDLHERRRRELVEAAYEVFSTRGYGAAGIADIAERLDIGHGTFYRYFESKRDILDHVVDHGVARIARAVQGDPMPQDAQTIDELVAGLRAVGDRLFGMLDDEPGLIQVLLLEGTSIDEELTYRVLGLVDTFAAVTASWLRRGQELGFVRAGLDVDVAARGINAMILPGLLAAVRGGVSPEERRRLTDGLVDLVTAGIAA